MSSIRSSSAVVLGAGLALAAVGLAPAAAQSPVIRVGVTAGPHAEIIEVVRKTAAERGIQIKPVEFTDYVIPNQALANKELEANSFQHEPYLKNQVAKTNWQLTKVGYTIASPMGFYSKKYKSFAELPSGATVAIQNDPSNAARSLQLLHANNIIKLKDGSSVTAGLIDIVENPEALQVRRARRSPAAALAARRRCRGRQQQLRRAGGPRPGEGTRSSRRPPTGPG